MSSLSWAVQDTWTITRRELAHWRMRPGETIINWLFPVMLLLVFGGLFGGAMRVPGDVSYYEFLIPGMLALSVFFGIEATMISVTTDVSKGITDRFRSLPMNAGAVLLGRCSVDLLNTVIGLVIISGTGLALGWRWHNGLGAALAAFGLLLVLRFAMLWIGVFAGLVIKSPQAMTTIQILIWPVAFLSSVFVDPATMPNWLGAVAAWSPLSATASASRELFGNPGYGGGADMILAVVWPVLLTAVFLPLSVRKYRKLGD